MDYVEYLNGRFKGIVKFNSDGFEILNLEKARNMSYCIGVELDAMDSTDDKFLAEQRNTLNTMLKTYNLEDTHWIILQIQNIYQYMLKEEEKFRYFKEHDNILVIPEDKFDENDNVIVKVPSNPSHCWNLKNSGFKEMSTQEVDKFKLKVLLKNYNWKGSLEKDEIWRIDNKLYLYSTNVSQYEIGSYFDYYEAITKERYSKIMKSWNEYDNDDKSEEKEA